MIPAHTWDEASAVPPTSTLVTASRRVERVHALDVLAAGRGRERFFFRAPNGGAPNGGALAGFGAAAAIFGYGAARGADIAEQARALFAHAAFDPAAPAHAQPRLFGGFAFREDFVPDEAWSAFHPAHFLLPHLQFVQDDAEAGGWLTLSALAPRDEDVAETRAALHAALDAHSDALTSDALTSDARATPAAPSADPRTPVDVHYPMDRAAWTTLIDRALADIDAGRLAKVVVARACELRSTAGFDLLSAVTQLDAEYPTCYRFCFEPRPGHAFLGATPELLVHTRGHTLHTMALAGSQARGETPQQDAALGEALLASDKDRREHRLVVDAILERLRPLAHALNTGDTDLLRLPNIQHLHTPVHAALRLPAAALDAVDALHPTPALGGAPRDAALRFLSAHEPLTRGWYAAPFGWFDAAFDGEFCVAIRSAVVQGARAWLYAGCGIVAGSHASREWDETTLKFRPMLRALGGHASPSERS